VVELHCGFEERASRAWRHSRESFAGVAHLTHNLVLSMASCLDASRKRRRIEILCFAMLFDGIIILSVVLTILIAVDLVKRIIKRK
jgi:hypothetical protein